MILDIRQKEPKMIKRGGITFSNCYHLFLIGSSEKDLKKKQEVKAWKETCEIMSDKKIMQSIQKSLRQIAQGRGIPLSKL